jgi:5-formyltetrahydrofolate cyclo-ligase
MANQGSTEKSRLRRAAKSLLQRVSQEQRRAWSERICTTIVERFTSAAIVGTYAPTSIEPDLDILWELGYLRERIALYPRVSGSALVWCEVQHLSQLRPGDFGLRSPDGDGSKRVPDLVLVPGLLFSRDRHRLGRGGGHYDRFLGLAAGAYQKIGVCFRMQLVPELPAEEHDVRLDDVVTD